MKRIPCLIAVAALLFSLVIPVLAGQNSIIIEGGDPVGSYVRLLVRNNSLEAQAATVYAKVILADGKTRSSWSRSPSAAAECRPRRCGSVTRFFA